MKIHQKPNKRVLLFIFLVVFSTLVLLGCQPKDNDDKNKQSNHQTAASTEKNIKAEKILPLPTEEGEFSDIHGWLDEQTIVYTETKGLSSQIFTYKIFTGERKMIFDSELAISSLTISPDQKWMVVQAANSTNKGLITVINEEGKSMWSESLPGTEQFISWNLYHPEEMTISSFSEDWTYNSYLLSIENGSLKEVQLPEPFVHWINREEFVFLDWNEESPSLLASLNQSSLDGNGSEQLFELFQVDTFQDVIMTIGVNPQNREEAIYTFMTNDYQEMSSFVIPHLSRFSDWLIPQYDLVHDNRFLTFKPQYSADADSYNGTFDLISTDVSSGQQEVLFENLDNEPISCAPEGEYCLYGHYLEKLLLLDSKEIITLKK
ncbi:hypothetical protein [Cytobacillus purgationiresistens]|uniref:YqgU-like 6-bladed beta-propeller domain-containing protein n=1 Tax=Cytobacillus purgationiresistens TaxID=863449 RepID=A0ABU0AFE3_9BACI|nr:hypothetical protein [Cytobacillus purgationiresistens]MDQ0269436.1 hypothetical protein [Cytobacillus purgationiresistens]